MTVGVGLVCEDVTSAIYMSLMFLLYSTFLFILLLFLLFVFLLIFVSTNSCSMPRLLTNVTFEFICWAIFYIIMLVFSAFMTFVTLRVILISVLFINFFDVNVAR